MKVLNFMNDTLYMPLSVINPKNNPEFEIDSNKLDAITRSSGICYNQSNCVPDENSQTNKSRSCSLFE